VTPLLLAASLEFGARNLWWASWPYEVKKQEARLSFSECTDKPLNLEKCTWGQKSENGKILLIGDSQAFAATEGVVAAGEKLGMRTVVSSRSGCPMSTLNSTGDKPIDCPSWQRDILEYALNSRPAVVVIANRSLGYTNLNKEWRTIIDSDGKVADSRNVLRLYSKGLEGVVELLVKSEIPVVILQNIPEAPSLIPLQPTLLNKMFPSIQPSSFDATESLAQRSHVASEEIRISRLSPLTSVVDPSHVLCNQNICTAKIGNRYLYQDIWHLSEDGSHLLSPLIQESILSLTTP
jgi:hypothetical protein